MHGARNTSNVACMITSIVVITLSGCATSAPRAPSAYEQRREQRREQLQPRQHEHERRERPHPRMMTPWEHE